jgi:predicted metal-dependent phosphoesterase TrpH
MNSKADLHLHTSSSDGKLTPRDLVDEAIKAKLNIMAVTDHDTIAGVEEALAYGNSQGIKVIPGIELSTYHNKESIHILGYIRGQGYKSINFNSSLQELIDYRIKRGLMIVENLNKYFNIKLSYEKILEEAKGVIARPHIAKAIVEAGYEYSWNYIFENIIGEKSPAYVPKKNLTIEEGIKLLRSVNSVVVLAHPVLIKKTPIEELLKFPFDGLEAIYYRNSKEDTEKYLEMAKKHKKLITAGSDFHGISENDRSHGSVGCVSLSGEHLDRFIEFYNN